MVMIYQTKQIVMGIKHFYIWFRQNFPQHIDALKRDERVPEVVDNLMLDMNGIFHTATQKIYQYGNYKPHKRLLGKPRVQPNGLDSQLSVFQEVCRIMENIVIVCRPRRRIVLCVDGPAPAAKMCQQRSRRFRSAKDASADVTRSFDTNSITPGTKFMDFLTKYIDWYIRKRISEPNSFWQDIEVIFSNEKAPGEGELKILSYIRYYGNLKESFCVHGLDADLIMHTLLTHLPRIYLLRDEMYDHEYDYHFINISQVSNTLARQLEWSSPDHKFCAKSAIHDFVFLCFLVGNDFLPQIPSLEILENGLDLLLATYISICKEQGHMTVNSPDSTALQFSKSALQSLLSVLGKYEQKNLENKLASKTPYFPDDILSKHSTRALSAQDDSGKWNVDINAYCADYVSSHFDESIDVVCHHYLEGMQWVFSYYTQGTTNWSWYFPYHYAPPASILAEYVQSYTKTNYTHSRPSMPFEQLLYVLPPRSASLLPKELSGFLSSPESPLAPFCPEDIEIDLSGKRREWEGIVLLPILNRNIARKCYLQGIDTVDPRDAKRNVRGRSFIYNYNSYGTRTFKSFYGNIYNCKVNMSLLDL